MKCKTTLAAGFFLWLSLAGGAVYLLMVVNGFFREMPYQMNDYQGFNRAATGLLAIVNLLLALSAGLVLYGVNKLWHARHLVHHNRLLMEDMRMSRAALEQKVSLLTEELNKTVAQLGQEAERRRLLAEQLKMQTTIDSVTGLLNRGTGMALLVNQMHMSERCQWPLTIWSVNIDNLKQIKERFGYRCGDQVVKEVSRIIRSSIRQSDTVFRMGEDELIVVLPQCSIQAAAAIIDRINTACRLEPQLNHCEWQPVITHGLAEYQPGCRVRVTDFIQQASLDARQRNILAENI